jgi:hypothetical protein
VGEPIDHLARLRRMDSDQKAAQVLAALDTMVTAGQTIKIATLARRAAVSRRFIYDHPELRAEAERRAAEVADLHIAALAGSARLTTASLRADLENAKARNDRLERELGVLRQRLGQVLGQEVLTEMAGRGALDTDAHAARRIDELEQKLFETGEEFARRTEELDAARQINRELMARLNRERS